MSAHISGITGTLVILLLRPNIKVLKQFEYFPAQKKDSTEKSTLHFKIVQNSNIYSSSAFESVKGRDQYSWAWIFIIETSLLGMQLSLLIDNSPAMGCYRARSAIHTKSYCRHARYPSPIARLDPIVWWPISGLSKLHHLLKHYVTCVISRLIIKVIYSSWGG